MFLWRNDENYLSIIIKYRNDPKFSDRYAWANNADPDQTPRGAVWSGSTLFTIPSASFGLIVEPHSSNFRVIRTNFLGVWIFRKFTVPTIVCSTATDCYSITYPCVRGSSHWVVLFLWFTKYTRPFASALFSGIINNISINRVVPFLWFTKYSSHLHLLSSLEK